MTVRKPMGSSWESWIDTQITQSRNRGEFDNLPGAGKPLPGLDQPHDEMWWVRSFLEREGLSFLPETLQLKLDVERGLEDVRSSHSRRNVERKLSEINARIIEVNSRSGRFDGPPSSVAPLNVERIIEEWEQQRAHERAVAHNSGTQIATPSPTISHDTVEKLQRAITLAVLSCLILTLVLLLAFKA